MDKGTSPALTVACSNGLKGAVRTLEADLRKKLGALAISYGSTRQFTDQLPPGTDVVIMSDTGIDAMIAGGKLAAGRFDLALSRMGVAVRAGAPRPEITTLEAFIAALRNAKSIGRSRQGISGVYLAGEFERLGLSDELGPKIKAYDGYAPQACANGEVEIVIQQISELVIVEGLDIVGPVPDGLQKVTTFSAGITMQSTHRESALAFIACLKAKEAAPTLRTNGLEPA
ncbi:MAG: molybdate ABC transporter substrate-binding protein [Proteobacteria bacterium]|nr:MAG: molybdate ABC transporter substrate-binding protein [Pseudomonadota bacterium]